MKTLITVQKPDGSRNFALVTRTSTIREWQVGLKAWILRLCSKPLRQIKQVTLGEYQVLRYLTLRHLHDLGQIPRAAELCLKLLKYCKPFDLFQFNTIISISLIYTVTYISYLLPNLAHLIYLFIYWLILTAYQNVYSYFMPWGLGSMYIVHL